MKCLQLTDCVFQQLSESCLETLDASYCTVSLLTYRAYSLPDTHLLI